MALVARQLDAYLQQLPRGPFEWAARNCCHFAAGWVAWVTGECPMQGLPSTPNARAAARLLRSLGGGLAQAWTLRLGRQPVPVGFARVGDLVLLRLPAGGQAMGVCGGLAVLAMGHQGDLLQLPLEDGLAAWRLRP